MPIRPTHEFLTPRDRVDAWWWQINRRRRRAIFRHHWLEQPPEAALIRQQHPACRSAAGRRWTPPPDGPLRRSWSAAPPDKLRRAHTPPVGVDRWRGGDPRTPLGARLLHAAVRKGEAEYQPIRPMPVLPV